MYALRNRVQLIGHLGKTPEVKQLDSGKKMAKFSVATNEEYKNANGEKVKETQWHNITVWGKTADVAEKYLSKGSEVVVEGKLIHRTYNDKDGTKKYITEVEVSEMLLIGRATTTSAE